MKLKNSFKHLTKFELCLWLFSLTAMMVSFLIPKKKDFLTLIASLIGVTALIFIAKGLVLGQILTVVFAIFYGLVSFFFKYYGEMITYLCMTAPSAVLAIISWVKHPYKNSDEVKINKMTKKQVVFMIFLTILATILFYFILGAFDNRNLIVSTLSITTSFLASYLTFMRSPFYAIAYAVNDIVLIVLWVLASIVNISYFPFVICFLLFLVNDIYGFINWKKMEKLQKENK